MLKYLLPFRKIVNVRGGSRKNGYTAFGIAAATNVASLVCSITWTSRTYLNQILLMVIEVEFDYFPDHRYYKARHWTIRHLNLEKYVKIYWRTVCRPIICCPWYGCEKEEETEEISYVWAHFYVNSPKIFKNCSLSDFPLNENQIQSKYLLQKR